ncbi:MAG: potassium channel family protein [Rhodovibrio sp.]|nr:potassium channel family protein [Rhodovibrio sp.]
MRSQTYIFVIAPIAVTALLASLPYLLPPSDRTIVWPAYLHATVAVFSATGPYVAHLVGRNVSTYTALMALAVNAVCLIVLFAGIYRAYGLAECPFPDTALAIYFSTVTWTTLGYGDFSPIDSLRLLSAGQAVIGYLFLGLIVGLLIEAATQARQ